METTCVILANGSFPTGRQALEALRAAGYICCCDGAVAKLLEAGMLPDVIIGDGDSIPPALKERFADIFIQVDEQEYNDMTKATRHCVARGFTSITYLGATGLREDHTIGNVFLLPFYLREFGIDARMLTDEGVFKAYDGRAVIKTCCGQQLSIFNISCTTLEGEGLEYALYPFSQMWQGTLNRAVCDEVRISGDGLFLCYCPFHD